MPRINCNVARTLPASTTNMTGFFIMVRGLSLINESPIARLTILVSQIACFLVVAISLKSRARIHQEMFDDWSKTQCRKERERSDDQNHAHQQHREQRCGYGKRSQRRRHEFLARQISGDC